MTSRRLPALDRTNPWSTRLAGRRARGARLIDLTESNPTSAGLSELDARAREALASPEVARYAPEARGLSSAREAVSAYYAAGGLPVSPEDVVLTASTSEAYAHLFRMLCDPGEAILVPQPSYPLFEPIAALEGVRAVGYRLERHARWTLDAASLESGAGDGARGIVVVQPNHPTGSCLTGEERRVLEATALKHGLPIVSDEVFGDFPWPRPVRGAENVLQAAARPDSADARASLDIEGREALPSLLEEPRALTFVLSGLSKVCGLPQLKLSWIVVAGPEDERRRALRELEWITDLFLSVSAPVQAALPALLESRHAFQARARGRIATNLERLRSLVARRPELEALDAEGGWVALLRMPLRRSDEEWALRLLDADVILHPGHFYDFVEPWFVVISLIVPSEAFEEGLGRIEAAVAES
jgi:alanine-synthesizing transaminase